MSEVVPINGKDFWVKIVEMLQQNWALVIPEASGSRVYFINDASGVFDEIAFPSEEDAVRSLRVNGFRRYADEPSLHSFLSPPMTPFHRAALPNGPIYSSGRFWTR
jgi:hypothetical protein